MRIGSTALTTGPGVINVGQAPDSTDKDWVVLLQRSNPEQVPDPK